MNAFLALLSAPATVTPLHASAAKPRTITAIATRSPLDQRLPLRGLVLSTFAIRIHLCNPSERHRVLPYLRILKTLPICSRRFEYFQIVPARMSGRVYAYATCKGSTIPLRVFGLRIHYRRSDLARVVLFTDDRDNADRPFSKVGQANQLWVLATAITITVTKVAIPTQPRTMPATAIPLPVCPRCLIWPSAT